MSWKLFLNRRLLVTLLLGFASGLPLALSSGTLQAWYTVAGLGMMTIGALTLVGQPYIYKPFWAPLLDRFVPPFLGRRRGWIVIMQFLLVIVLVMMAFLNPKVSPILLSFLALGVALFSATQDIAIDAYRVDLLSPQERGMGAAMLNLGYRMAMLVSGGLALVIAAKTSWHTTYLIMAFLMGCGILATWWGPEPEKQIQAPVTLKQAIVEPLRDLLKRKGIVTILLFIVTYKLCDALALALGTPFLIRGVGFSLMAVGSIYKTVGMIATIIGAFAGGLLMMPLGLYRSLLYFGLLQGVSNLMFALLAMIGKSYFLLIATIFLESFCGGLSNVAIVAFLMSLCDVRFSATQYAIFAAFSAIGRVFVGPLAAVMVEHIGWVKFYMATCLIVFPSLFLLSRLRGQVDDAQQLMTAKTNESLERVN